MGITSSEILQCQLNSIRDELETQKRRKRITKRVNEGLPPDIGMEYVFIESEELYDMEVDAEYHREEVDKLFEKMYAKKLTGKEVDEIIKQRGLAKTAGSKDMNELFKRAKITKAHDAVTGMGYFQKEEE